MKNDPKKRPKPNSPPKTQHKKNALHFTPIVNINKTLLNVLSPVPVLTKSVNKSQKQKYYDLLLIINYSVWDIRKIWNNSKRKSRFKRGKNVRTEVGYNIKSLLLLLIYMSLKDKIFLNKFFFVTFI